MRRTCRTPSSPTPTCILEVDQTKQYTGLGISGRDDPTGGIAINGVEIMPLVIRDNPQRWAQTTNYLQYTGEDHVVLGGTAGNDIIISGDGDDTLYGDAGNDRLEGGYRQRHSARWRRRRHHPPIMGGDDIIQGGAGNDVIQAGNMSTLAIGNLILGGDGKDFIITSEDISTIFGGQGDDFILGRQDQPAADRQRGRRLDRDRAPRTARPATTSHRCWPTTCSATTSSSAAAASTR